MKDLSSRERDVLNRLYCLDQDPGQIQRETGMTPAAIRNLRSRVRSRLLKSS